ncbi:MAG: cytochrome c biogenesis protein ResB [Desulfobacterales bacterium]|jgi:cytochrome c biogenesis protein
MTNQVSTAGLFHNIWDFFSSVKLTIVLLLSLAATSIVGTLIPQNEDPAAYFKAFGGYLFRLFSILDLFDMYHSWWFQLLLILLTINIIVCSIDRMSSNRRILFAKNPAYKLPRFRNLKRNEKFDERRSPEQLKNIYQKLVARHFHSSHVEPTEKGFAIFGEKGRWTRFGVYTVHFSVVLLLIGGLIGSIFGFDGYVNIPEGESTQRIQIRNSAESFTLPFEIRCDDYSESYYENGTPKEFRSSLTILENGTAVAKKDILVNDPLHYKGIRIYQSSRGTIPSNEWVLSFTSRESGKVYTQKTSVGQPVVIPEDLGSFVIRDLVRSYKFKGHDVGDAMIGTLTPVDGDPIEVALPLRFPSFDKMRKGDVMIAAVENVPRFYTGLQVSRDPGVWVVYCGFILMIIGCYITFFMSHQQICVELVQSGKKTEVIVAGTANKNKTGMEAKVNGFAGKLARIEEK